ncbi:hypothetical protein [Neorhizobium sp. SOG26]|uniref:hypothetical protein n=1 Tax=Neorhizobium sp. SOG26 TaxID=2060726 RepID=UPI0012376A57|nr:hypothetical protein [Neorhizobium sp. SOG26]
MPKLYDGLALGGPLDGKRITHQGPHYKAAEQNQVLPFISFKETLTTAQLTHDIFEYCHFRTPGGDVWIPSDVQSGKRYEHKIWDHPMEYVFSKLIRSYRPEGY